MAQGKSKKPVVPVTEADINIFEAELIKFVNDARQLTNKAAASRARVTSLNLEKLFKAYRFNSIKSSFKK